MASITSSKNYTIGEEPIFLAYVYHSTAGVETPFTRQEVRSVLVSHLVNRMGMKNGVPTQGWYPVEHSGVTFDRREISAKSFLDSVVSQAGTAAFDHTHGRIFDYNFVYLPVHANWYFLDTGEYRTVFTVTLTDGQTEVITFSSKCEEIDVPGISMAGVYPTWGTKLQTSQARFGDNVPFLGRIYTKVRQEDGTIVYPEKDNDYIGNVFLTIYEGNGSEHLPRTSITSNVVLEASETVPLEYNFTYTLPKQYLRQSGNFMLRFEITGPENTLKCRWIAYLTVT